MARIIIPSGAVVLIASDRRAPEENRRRAVAAAGLRGTAFGGAGARLIPPWLCMIHGDREALASLLTTGAVRASWPFHPDPSRVTLEVGAFDWRAEDFRPASSLGKALPHAFVHPTYEHHFGAWLETTSGATITTEQGDDIGRDVETPSKPRGRRAANKDAA